MKIVGKMELMVFVLAIIFLTTGCWSSIELGERAIVAGLGVDQAEEGKITLSMQVIRTGDGGDKDMGGMAGGGGGPGRVMVYSSTGHTISETLNDLNMSVGKDFFLTEGKVVLVSEALAREGIGKVMDFLQRSREISTLSLVLVAKGEARQVLETEMGQEDIWAFGLNRAVRTASRHGHVPEVEIHHLLNMMESKTQAAVLPQVRVVTMGVEEGQKEQQNSQQRVMLPRSLKMDGTAVFKRDKMIGWLDERETSGLTWVIGKKEHRIISVEGKEPHRIVAIETARSSGNICPEIKDGLLNIVIKVEEEGFVTEIEPDNFDLNNPTDISELENRKRAVIEGEIHAALIRAMELNADIFGIGEAVRRKFPREWRQWEGQWEEIFLALDVQVQVDAKITGKQR